MTDTPCQITDRARLVCTASRQTEVCTDSSRHAWMSYMVDKSPAEDKLLQRSIRAWEPEKHVPVMTASRSAFKTFSTYVYFSSRPGVCKHLTSFLQNQEQVSAMATDCSASIRHRNAWNGEWAILGGERSKDHQNLLRTADSRQRAASLGRGEVPLTHTRVESNIVVEMSPMSIQCNNAISKL